MNANKLRLRADFNAHQSGIEPYQMKKWIRYCRMIYEGLRELYYVFALATLLKGGLTLWSALHLTLG
jgi:hypothetical protein